MCSCIFWLFKIGLDLIYLVYFCNGSLYNNLSMRLSYYFFPFPSTKSDLFRVTQNISKKEESITFHSMRWIGFHREC